MNTESLSKFLNSRFHDQTRFVISCWNEQEPAVWYYPDHQMNCFEIVQDLIDKDFEFIKVCMYKNTSDDSTETIWSYKRGDTEKMENVVEALSSL